jgi:uncharacterized membrane protein YhaH (DUF805 family)
MRRRSNSDEFWIVAMVVVIVGIPIIFGILMAK